MNFNMLDDFNWPIDEIAKLLADEELVNFDDLPNVTKRKQIERRWEGTRLYKKFEWNVHGQIPKIARKLIKPEMLSFIESSVWDNEKYRFETKITPHYLKKLINCKTVSQWEKTGENSARRKFFGNLDVNIPVIGPVVEKAMLDQMKKNTDKGTVELRRIFEERIGPVNNQL
ncbi:MAG TPA: DUF2505 family protein [bacterium]|nr:DUF2505 family protein [bacterium]